MNASRGRPSGTEGISFFSFESLSLPPLTVTSSAKPRAIQPVPMNKRLILGRMDLGSVKTGGAGRARVLGRQLNVDACAGVAGASAACGRWHKGALHIVFAGASLSPRAECLEHAAAALRIEDELRVYRAAEPRILTRGVVIVVVVNGRDDESSVVVTEISIETSLVITIGENSVKVSVVEVESFDVS